MWIEYRLALMLGRAIVATGVNLNSLTQGTSHVSSFLEAGNSCSSAELLEVQNFGARVWFAFSAGAMLFNLPLLALMVAVNPDSAGREIFSYVMYAFVFLAAVGILQALVLKFRAARTESFVLRHAHEADSVSLPSDSDGISRGFDFWIAFIIAAIFYGILLFAASR